MIESTLVYVTEANFWPDRQGEEVPGVMEGGSDGMRERVRKREE